MAPTTRVKRKRGGQTTPPAPTSLGVGPHGGKVGAGTTQHPTPGQQRGGKTTHKPRTSSQHKSKLLKGGCIGDYKEDYHRGY